MTVSARSNTGNTPGWPSTADAAGRAAPRARSWSGLRKRQAAGGRPRTRGPPCWQSPERPLRRLYLLRGMDGQRCAFGYDAVNELKSLVEFAKGARSGLYVVEAQRVPVVKR